MILFQPIINKVKSGLSKTKEAFTKRLRNIVSIFKKIDNDLLDQIEGTLISADIGIETSLTLRKSLENGWKDGKIKSPDEIIGYLKTELKSQLKKGNNGINFAISPPTVILVVGVNGTGKTTSIGKLSKFFHNRGKKVILAASDTFRTAAIEQLAIWSERAGVEIVKHQIGGDPAAVAFDAAEAAISRKADILIVDTAGRLQTKVNLMKELSKISNVLAKKIPNSPHETLLVLDATTGQNAISQAMHFNEATKVTGIFLAKLDGTAKGGIVIAIKNKLQIPVKFIGVGEGIDDIAVFDENTFVDALFET